MTIKSPRMAWPYPDQNQASWFEAFQAMVNAIDASGYAAREDRQLVVMGGGYFLLTADTLSWSDDIEILAALSGFKWVIPAGSIPLADGQLTYMTLVRAPSSNTTLELKSGYRVPSTDNDLFFCVRSGSVVYFRNGRGILADTPEIIWKGGSPSPGPAPSDINATSISPLAIGDAVYLAGAQTVDKASATSTATVPVIGFSVTAVPAGPCIIRRIGLIPITTVVLIPGDTYWLDTIPGRIRNTPVGLVPGNFIQELGVAFDASNLLIALDADWTVI